MKVGSADVLEKIYAETLILITTFGAKGWTMNTVCQKSGVAKDTLYRIIKSKDDLIKTVLLLELDKHIDGIHFQIDNSSDFFDTLNALFTLLTGFFSKFSLAQLGQLFIEYPALEKEVNAKMSGIFAQIEAFVSSGIQTGCIRSSVDPHLLVRIIHICTMQFLKEPESYSVERDLRTLLHYLTEGIQE